MPYQQNKVSYSAGSERNELANTSNFFIVVKT